jgi:hypothetical protein
LQLKKEEKNMDFESFKEKVLGAYPGALVSQCGFSWVARIRVERKTFVLNYSSKEKYLISQMRLEGEAIFDSFEEVKKYIES